MATYKFILWKQFTNKEGKHPIRLCVRKDNATKYITTTLSATAEQWNEKEGRYKVNADIKMEMVSNKPMSQQPKAIRDAYKVELERLNPNSEEDNAYITKRLSLINDIIRQFEEGHINWTLQQFEDKYCNKSKQGLVVPFFEKHIADLKSTGNIGNAECYQRTLNMLLLFDKTIIKKTFADINLNYVRNFDSWMKKPRKTEYKSTKGKCWVVERAACKGNTRKYYLKALRAIFNLAMTLGEATGDNYPFGKGGFEVAGLEEETEKRYLSNSDLEKIKNADFTRSYKTNDRQDLGMEEFRRVFLFLYYSFGMSFVDAAHLKKANIEVKDGKRFIVYKREKLKNSKKAGTITISISVAIQEQLDWFAENSLLIGDYLVPIVSKEGMQGEALYNHIRNRYKILKRYLTNIQKDLQLESRHLTSYVSRHTFAMQLQNNEIPRELISQALGHKNMKTTQTYLDSFADSKVAKLSDVL